MFGKIKNKLRNVFSKNEEVIEEDVDTQEFEEDIQVEEPLEEVKEDIQVKEKKEEEEEKKKKKNIVEPTKEKEKSKNVDVIEKREDETVDSIDENIEDEPKEEKKKGFLSKLFGSKEEEKEEKDEETLEQVEDSTLEDVSEEEKEAIKEKKELPKNVVGGNKKEIYAKLAKEEEEEKREALEIEEEKPKKEKKSYSDVNENKGLISKTFSKLKAKKLTQEDFNKIWIELEVFLLEINIAFEIVEKIESSLKEALINNSFDRFALSKKIREVLVKEIRIVLEKREDDLLAKIREINKNGEVCKILVLGVNGTGKTTTIAKIVHMFQENNISVVVAAADTFRAAAVEQLDEHAKKLNFKLIQHKGGSDPAAVAFDAIEHAKAKNLDVALIDTAGRMPNNSNLMQELNKIERVTKSDINLFIGDSISGNDLIDQITLFDKVVGIDGMILTKTDTDERPGSIVTAAYSIEKPIYYLGVGQNYDDLVKFDAEFVADKLFEIDDEGEN